MRYLPRVVLQMKFSALIVHVITCPCRCQQGTEGYCWQLGFGLYDRLPSLSDWMLAV